MTGYQRVNEISTFKKIKKLIHVHVLFSNKCKKKKKKLLKSKNIGKIKSKIIL